MFADDVVFETTKGPIKFDSEVAYAGTLEGKTADFFFFFEFALRIVKKRSGIIQQ